MVSVTSAPHISLSERACGSGGLSIRVVDRLEDWMSMQADWDGFLSRCGVKNLCMTHVWLRTWLQHFPPQRLCILIAQNAQGQWQGVAPLQVTRSRKGLFQRALRQMQFIGTDPTVYDWMSIAICPKADPQAVLAAMARTVDEARDWDVLDLQFGPERDSLDELARQLGHGPEQTVRSDMSIPYTPLPDSEEAYMQVRRKKTRLEVNRHCNRFVRQFGTAPELVFHAGDATTDAMLDHFAQGHITYWRQRGCNSDFNRYPALIDFYRDLVCAPDTQAGCDATPQLRFSVLHLGELQLSYHLGFWQGNSYLSHLTHFNQGFREYSPGTIHMDALVFDTVRRGGVEFEFGRGDEPYKKMWATDKKPLWSLRLFRHPWAARLWQLDAWLKQIKQRLGQRRA